MRLALALFVVMAGAAHAQSERERAHDMIAASIVEGGFDAAISAHVAECYTTRMSEAEVAALVAAEGDVQAQQAIIANMAEGEAALGCVAAALQ